MKRRVVGCASSCFSPLGEGSEEMVVVREVRFVVSAEGGGGRVEVWRELRTVIARQRKHSPLPK